MLLAHLPDRMQVWDVSRKEPKQLLGARKLGGDALNAKVALSSNEAARKANSGALWIAYTNNEVDAINKEQTDRLQSKDNPIRSIWARQV